MPRGPEERMNTPQKVEIGSTVGVDFGSEVRPALVIEDRGDLGPGGEQVVRLLLRVPPDDEAEIEMAVSWLLPWPPEPADPKPKRARRAGSHSKRAPA